MSLSANFDRQRRDWHDAQILPYPPLSDLERVPIPRDAVPKRVVSHEIEAQERDFAKLPYEAAMRDVHARLMAEDARLRRILPAPPFGKKWLGEIQAHDRAMSGSGFHLHAELVLRVVYRLVDE
jgi:hypothetical protein